MALTLIKSEFRPSTIPDAVILNCEWDLNGRRSYSSVIVTPNALADPHLWRDMEDQVIIWHRHRRKQGEIMVLHDSPRDAARE